MSCCTRGKTRVHLEYPINYLHFVSYPTFCRHLNILAYHGLAQIVFPSIITGATKQISILECTTNTLVYDENGAPVLATQVEPNRPYNIYFCENYGGYVLECFFVPQPEVDGEEVPSVMKTNKEVVKK